MDERAPLSWPIDERTKKTFVVDLFLHFAFRNPRLERGAFSFDSRSQAQISIECYCSAQERSSASSEERAKKGDEKQATVLAAREIKPRQRTKKQEPLFVFYPLSLSLSQPLPLPLPSLNLS